MSTFNLEVSYGQLAVFDSKLVKPFNDWSEACVAQGFSWSPGSVSFATLDGSGSILVTVSQLSSPASLGDESVTRAIAVPFTVPEHGKVEVATISASAFLQLPQGEYELTFWHGQLSSNQMLAWLNFARVDVPQKARIIRADLALNRQPSS
jgi:hypothetical protein